VYCRFTIHREAIQLIKYLPKTRTFLTFCVERDLKIWRVDNETKSHRVLKTFRLHRDIEDIYVFLSTEVRADFDRFMMIFKTGESELFEWNNNTMVNVDGKMEKTEVLLYIE
jgi:hypothetical protein